MTIEITDEMVKAFERHFFTCFREQDLRDALASVLTIVERDYPVGPVMCDGGPHPTEPLAYCDLPRGHEGKHSGTVEKAVRW